MSFQLSLEQIKAYHKDGYLIVKNFCSKAETDKLYRTALADSVMSKNALDQMTRVARQQNYRFGLHPAMMYSATSPAVKK